MIRFFFGFPMNRSVMKSFKYNISNYNKHLPIFGCAFFGFWCVYEQLTAENGYVWFLPHRLEKNTTKLLQLAAKDGCTELQLNEMLEGHFSLSQPLYADDSAAMETDGTVAEWKADYLGVNSSHYGSYAYDAGNKIGLFSLKFDRTIL